jgi:hypothetical protein
LILVKNDGRLILRGDTSAEEVVLRWGRITARGNLHVATSLTLERGNMTAYGTNNSARTVQILSGTTLRVLGTWVVHTMRIRARGKVRLIPFSDALPGSGTFALKCRQLTVASGAAIDADAVGADPRGFGGGYNFSGGGGYGGKGGRGYWTATHPGDTYGDQHSLTIDMGASGGYTSLQQPTG